MRAGFKHGNRVEVRLDELGKLTLQIVGARVGSDKVNHQPHSAIFADIGEML